MVRNYLDGAVVGVAGVGFCARGVTEDVGVRGRVFSVT
jgi:hypothetical protein